jgi:type VI protein secretion system component Hcp
MPVKKNSSNAKKSTTASKRHAKLAVPKKGEKVSSMKTADFHFTHPIDKGSPKLFL